MFSFLSTDKSSVAVTVSVCRLILTVNGTAEVCERCVRFEEESDGMFTWMVDICCRPRPKPARTMMRLKAIPMMGLVYSGGKWYQRCLHSDRGRRKLAALRETNCTFDFPAYATRVKREKKLRSLSVTTAAHQGTSNVRVDDRTFHDHDDNVL